MPRELGALHVAFYAQKTFLINLVIYIYYSGKGISPAQAKAAERDDDETNESRIEPVTLVPLKRYHFGLPFEGALRNKEFFTCRSTRYLFGSSSLGF